MPETVKYILKGKKRADVAAKDVMLHILASDYMKSSQGIGKVLEFAGEDYAEWKEGNKPGRERYQKSFAALEAAVAKKDKAATVEARQNLLKSCGACHYGGAPGGTGGGRQ